VLDLLGVPLFSHTNVGISFMVSKARAGKAVQESAQGKPAMCKEGRVLRKRLAPYAHAALQANTAAPLERTEATLCPRCGRASHQGQCRL
jgi:hypothetical protein